MESETGIRRIHKFVYTDSEVINAAFDESVASCIRAHAINFARFLQHIHQHSVEVQMNAAPDAFRVRSYHKDGGVDPTQASGVQPRLMTTEMAIDLREFEQYDFRSELSEVELIFCLKELKGLLTLCEQADVLEVELFFTLSGAPVKVSCEQPGGMDVSLVLATLAPSTDASQGEEKEEAEEEAQLSQLPPPPQLPGQDSYQGRYF